MILYAIIVILIILSLVAYVAFQKGQQQYTREVYHLSDDFDYEEGKDE